MATQQVKSDLNLDGAFQASGNIRADGVFNCAGTSGVTTAVTVVTDIEWRTGSALYMRKAQLNFKGGIYYSQTDLGWSEVQYV